MRAGVRWCVVGLVLWWAPAAGAQPEAGAATGTSVRSDASSDAPKVAVVVAGDPDEALRAAAAAIDRALGESGELALPSDPGLRAALRGELASEGDDGLARVRAERRRLGAGEADELRSLGLLGRIAGAGALVVVRRVPTGIVAEVMDVGRGALFDGSVAASDATAVVSFAGVRARAAARAAREGTPADAPVDAPVASERPAQPDDAARQPRAEAREPALQEGGDDEEDDGLLDEWPLLVAGALLVGFILLFSLDDEPAESGPPVLRFEAGGS